MADEYAHVFQISDTNYTFVLLIELKKTRQDQLMINRWRQYNAKNSDIDFKNPGFKGTGKCNGNVSTLYLKDNSLFATITFNKALNNLTKGSIGTYVDYYKDPTEPGKPKENQTRQIKFLYIAKFSGDSDKMEQVSLVHVANRIVG